MTSFLIVSQSCFLIRDSHRFLDTKSVREKKTNRFLRFLQPNGPPVFWFRLLCLARFQLFYQLFVYASTSFDVFNNFNKKNIVSWPILWWSLSPLNVFFVASFCSVPMKIKFDDFKSKKKSSSKLNTSQLAFTSLWGLQNLICLELFSSPKAHN